MESSEASLDPLRQLACLQAMEIDSWSCRKPLPGARQPEAITVVAEQAVELQAHEADDLAPAAQPASEVVQLEDFPASFASQPSTTEPSPKPQVQTETTLAQVEAPAAVTSIELGPEKACLLMQPLVANARCDYLLIVGFSDRDISQSGVHNMPLMDHNALALLQKIAASVGLQNHLHIGLLVNPDHQKSLGSLAQVAPLKQQLQQLPAKKVILLGGEVQKLWGNCKTLGRYQNPQMDTLNEPAEMPEPEFFNTPHPSEMLIEPLLKRRAWHDWKQLQSELEI